MQCRGGRLPDPEFNWGHYALFLSLPLKSGNVPLFTFSSGTGDRAVAAGPWRQSHRNALVSLGQMAVSGKPQDLCHPPHFRSNSPLTVTIYLSLSRPPRADRSPVRGTIQLRFHQHLFIAHRNPELHQCRQYFSQPNYSLQLLWKLSLQ